MEHVSSETYTRMNDRFNSSRVISVECKTQYLQKILGLLCRFERENHELYEKYKTAPASTRYHGAYAGGLFDHSFNVCFNLLEWINQNKNTGLTPDDCILVGMLHDLCKAETYYKTEDGKYTYDKTKVRSHAKFSVELIKSLKFKLNSKQRVLILLHMSSWHKPEDVKAMTLKDKFWLKSSIKHIRLLQAVNWADMKATQDEMIEELKK